MPTAFSFFRGQAGDYDGDGLIEAAVFRPSSAAWLINRTSGGDSVFGFGLPVDQSFIAAFVP